MNRMNSYCFPYFPYSHLANNSRIVLYAAGCVGQAYYRQLQMTNYAKVVLWVDKEPVCKDVSPIAKLLELNTDSYDYIIIAVASEKLANEVIHELVMLGIESNKIIHALPIFSQWDEMTGMGSMLTLEELVSGDNKGIKEAVEDYFLYGNCDINYFSKLIKEVNEYTDFESSRRLYVHNCVVGHIRCTGLLLSPESKLVLLRILIETGCFYSEALKLCVESAALLESGCSQKYFIYADISNVWGLYPEAIYSGFFSEMLELSGNIAAELRLKWDTEPYRHKENKRICVLLPQVNDSFKPILDLTSMIVSGFIERGYVIHIVDLESALYDGKVYFLKPRHMQTLKESSINPSMRRYFDESVIYHYTDVRDFKERQMGILAIVADINPLCVLSVGRPTAISSYYIYQKFPVVHLPMEMVEYTTAFSHKVIAYGNSKVRSPITPDQVIRLPILHKMPSPQKVHTRLDYNLSDENIVCITVGNRLAYDISVNLFDDMYRLMLKNRNIKWLIVGAETLPYVGKYPKDVLDDCIRFVGYEFDLPGLYQICDIYVNPYRVGGGTTVAWATESGIAVIAPKNANGSYLLFGEDYCVENEVDIASEVSSLAEDPTLLESKKTNAKKLSQEWGPEKVAGILEKGILKLAKDFADGKISVNKAPK